MTLNIKHGFPCYPDSMYTIDVSCAKTSADVLNQKRQLPLSESLLPTFFNEVCCVATVFNWLPTYIAHRIISMLKVKAVMICEPVKIVCFVV